jgi:hypothetical protein
MSLLIDISVVYANDPSVNMTMNNSSVKSALIIVSNCERSILNCQLFSSDKIQYHHQHRSKNYKIAMKKSHWSRTFHSAESLPQFYFTLSFDFVAFSLTKLFNIQ